MKAGKQSEAESHFGRLEKMMKKVLSVSKSEMQKRDAEWKKQRTN